jgi:hypothetical protein
MRKGGTSTASAARTRRIAWLVSFVVPLVVLVLMLVALKPAHATTAGAVPGGALTAPPAVAALGEPAEEEGEGEAEEPEVEFEEACEEVEAEQEEGEETEVEAGEEEGEEAAEGCKAGGAPPASCLLRTANARVLVYARQNRVRLLVDYTSSAHTQATVEYRLEGHGGSLLLGRAKRRLASRGLLDLTEHLSAARIAKARAAKGFLVELQIPAAPRACLPFDTRHLTAKRTTRSETVWSQGRS